MARVASCPHCEHELLIPAGADAKALASCPECHAFFELKDANARELPEIKLVGSDAEDSHPQTSATVTDFSSFPTLPGNLHQHGVTADTEEEAGPGMLHFEEQHETSDLPQHAPPELIETPEAAAQRIDAWFRSAKTLDDVSPSQFEAAEHNDEPMIEQTHQAAGGATIDMSVGDTGIADHIADFELEPPAEVPQPTGTWDDSQHMDQLLAGLKDQPTDTYEPGEHETHHEAVHEEDYQREDEWAPDTSIGIAPLVGRGKKKRSVVKTLVGTVVGGVVGLALAYYALLWIRGPAIDVLELAKYLPQAALPASFREDPNQESERPSTMAADLAAAEKANESKSQTPVAPAEKQAVYTESTTPAEPAKANSATADRYATPPTKEESPPREPAMLDAPPAKALPSAAKSNDAGAIQIASAPKFTASDVETALSTAKEARPMLEAGDLSDSKLGPTKGKGYMALADLAQKATFVKQSPPLDAAKAAPQLGSEIESFFRATLANSHTRNEVSQIALKWLAHSTRPQNGIFFAGTLVRPESKGTVAECSVDVGGGRSVTVLVPAVAASQIRDSSRPMIIVGWIVGKPAEQVPGYTGSAQQAVFAKTLFSLE